MRVMVFVKATEAREKGIVCTPETEAMRAEMGRFNDALVAAGILKEGEGDGLQPTSAAKRIAFDGAARTVIDGPFTPARDQVAGWWLWTVKDRAEAVAWAKRCPNPMSGPSELEIRPCEESA
ncbi:hypothetical protein sos41_28760 [Alphaproteobacteria bacterium SO-S41]|nr:hypothetical protein sos41_28760 [Alphaproteobacteria bacterium SO-S41]